MGTDLKIAAARAFVRSLNILLKFARLYEFGHARTAKQLETTWAELRAAVPEGSETGLLLGATGSQLLLDGVPLGSSQTERSFAHLLSSSGIASIHFSPHTTKEDLERLARGFSTGGSGDKPEALAAQLKAALQQATGIRVNTIRFVAEDSAITDIKLAAQLTARTLGATGEQFKAWFNDPQKLLQLIVAASGARSGFGGGSSAAGSGAQRSATEDQAGSGTEPAGAPDWQGGFSSAPGGASGQKGPGRSGSEDAPGMDRASDSQPSHTAHLVERLAAEEARGSWVSHTGGAEMFAVGGAQQISALPGVPNASPEFATTTAVSEPGLPVLPGMRAAETSPTGIVFSERDIFDLVRILKNLGELSQEKDSPEAAAEFQMRLTELSVQSQDLLRMALSTVGSQLAVERPDSSLLVKLAEHLAIRFALENYKSGAVHVNAVKQLFDRMAREIDALRKVLRSHEEKLQRAGVEVESHAELLDQQFWAAIPDEEKRMVLRSPDAWCVPPRNVRACVDDLRKRGSETVACDLLLNYASCVAARDVEARRATATGLAELADLYRSRDGTLLTDAINQMGTQLGVESDLELQSLISAAFVRLAQEAAAQRCPPAMLRAVISLGNVEKARPDFAETLRKRIDIEGILGNFIEDAMHAGHMPEGLADLLCALPRLATDRLALRFGRAAFRDDCNLLLAMASDLGEQCTAQLSETLRSAPAEVAAETVGLLSRLDASAIEQVLSQRLRDWPRSVQDRVIRQLAVGGAPLRGRILVSLFETFDPLIRPLALDEIGLCGDLGNVPWLLDLVAGKLKGHSPYIQLKAIEALGRLGAVDATELLRSIVEARTTWRWVRPSELRIAALHALERIDADWVKSYLPRSGLDAAGLAVGVPSGDANSSCARQRKYPRLRFKRALQAVTVNLRENLRLDIREFNLGGGIAITDRHVPPGTLIVLRFAGRKPIKAQALVRGARTQSMGFEIIDIDLEERACLRRLLAELQAAPLPGSPRSRSRHVRRPSSSWLK